MSFERDDLREKSVDELLKRFIALCKGALLLWDALRERKALDQARPAFMRLLSGEGRQE
jgi:hypothetical protein